MSNKLVKVEFNPATINADFDSMGAQLDKWLEPFSGITAESVISIDTKQLKACKAQLNAWSKELNDGRKAVKRDYNEPLKRFEAEVKVLDARILEPVGVITAELNRREEEEKAQRYDELRAAYEEFAPALVPVVPFERIFQPEWTNKTGYSKRKEEMFDKVEQIATDWAALKDLELNYPEESERVFFETFSLPDAIRFDEAHKAEMARISELNEYVGASADKTPETANQGAEQPEACEPERFKYVFEVYMTPEERDMLIDFFKQHNITGTARRSK